MRGVASSQSEAKILAIFDSASATLGVPATQSEAAYAQALASEIRRHVRALRTLHQRAEPLSALAESVTQVRPVLGLMTAIVLYVDLGGSEAG